MPLTDTRVPVFFIILQGQKKPGSDIVFKPEPESQCI
jgi:hypothetical protein